MKSLLFLILITGIGISGSFGQTERRVDNTTVDSLDIKKYAGLWYEIARLDHPFERGMVGVTTNYIIKPDGDIEVIGCGYLDSLNGEKREVAGRVHIPNKKKPGILRVTFFLFFNADYYILEVEPDYSAALIGSSEVDHLWIVSRTPNISKKKLKDLVNRAQKRGYDTEALIFVPHKNTDIQDELAKRQIPKVFVSK